MADKQPWVGTVRLSDKDAETLAWLSRKMAPRKGSGITGSWRVGLPFADVIRRALRNERARIEREGK